MADALVVKSHAAIATRNAASSPLLRLPAELRNKIYAYVLILNEGITTWKYSLLHGGTPMKVSESIEKLRMQADYFALLRTCRQIHSEARLLPFVLNTVDFASVEVVTRWIEATKVSQRAAVTRVSVLELWSVRVRIFLEEMERLGFGSARDVWPNLVHMEWTFEFWNRELGERLREWLKGGAEYIEVIEHFYEGKVVLEIIRNA